MIKIFISSVQSEFEPKREMLYEYLKSDPVLGKFFEPFIFEKLPAADKTAKQMYLEEVKNSDIYIGLFGKKYGYEDSDGVSPTEREFVCATDNNLTRFIFITEHKDSDRHQKEIKLIKKSEKVVIRKQFSSVMDLKASVYASLVRYLEENEYIRIGPFDSTLHLKADIEDIDLVKVSEFVKIAKQERGFPLSPESDFKNILTHLNLIQNIRVTNAAILLFGKQPQKYFLNSEIKCAHFHGYEIEKPIPSYQVYKGDMFRVIDQALDFILSKISFWVGTREESVRVPTKYELPRGAVREAIVNAVVHRDYTSNASVQVMLFKDRLEIWNPGRLPHGLTVADLKKPHTSIPHNMLLAEPMYQTRYIERMGTGTGDIIRLCKEFGLKEPEFKNEQTFKTVIWRKEGHKGASVDVIPVHGNVGVGNKLVEKLGRSWEEVGKKAQVRAQVRAQVNDVVIDRIIDTLIYCDSPRSRAEILLNIGLSDRYHNFKANILPALTEGLIEYTIPDKPQSRLQKYILSEKGKDLLKSTIER
ncbi:MAG: DUF4062 domain-containing protein [Candidatus Delongbacteria bacterium]|jgi:ATP-dependent DNA helicase RecG|nr:DUF4062 domain-containing protein [Candidatus Delongbacteria bacterium]